MHKAAVMTMRFAIFILMAAYIQAQQVDAISPYNPLQLKEFVPIEEQKSVAAIGYSRCDAEGSIYFQAAPEGVPDKSMILRVDAAKRKRFSISLQDVPELRAALGGAFTVSNDSVYLLAFVYAPKKKHELWMARFSTEGRYKARVLIDQGITAKGFSPRQFVVFPSGEIFLAGRADESIGGKSFERALAAIFDANGKFLREVVFEEDSQTKEKIKNLADYAATGKEPPEEIRGALRSLDLADAKIGTDGNVYSMRYGLSPKVYVINVVGEVVRIIKISSPEDGLNAAGFQLTNNRIAVRFLDFENPAKGALYTITDLTSGERILTTDGSKLSRSFACFLPDGNFEFLSHKKGSMGVDIAIPR